ncbi:MAG: hypothetical protein AAFV07_21200, partial [Bacteroidota bacterium]
MLRHTPRVRKAVYFMGFLSMGLGVCTLLLSYGYLTYQHYMEGRSCETWLSETAVGLELSTTVVSVEDVSAC